VAACGGTVAKMSGRGLGHTGGTLDKLEAIPGCRVDIPMEEFRTIVRDIGLAVVGQTDNLVPADKKIYALRDVTSTVRSIPLITSSIMSKKLASGADAIVLDVKTGSGAFMEKMKDARSLARQMVEIGWQLDRRVSAVITDMNQPLGMAVGNALEVREAVELLSGRIPAGDPLYEVCMVLAGQMLLLGGLVFSETEARQKLEEALHSGAGLEKLRQMVARQGGDETVLTPEGMDALCAVRQKVAFCAEKDGFVADMNAALIGSCAQLLGAGRAKKGDPIDPAVGLVMSVRRGDAVRAGDTLCTLYVNDDANLPEVRRRLGRAITVAPEAPESIPVIYEVIGA